MTKLALLGAAALVCVGAATPVKAQEVIYNPGYCAQFYPNANCQNKGPNNPYTGDISAASKRATRSFLVPARAPREQSSSSAAAAGASIATNLYENEASALPTAGAHSLAIPISLITRAYLAS